MWTDLALPRAEQPLGHAGRSLGGSSFEDQ